jgi:hypothetical protein
MSGVNPFAVVLQVGSFNEGIKSMEAAKKAKKIRRRITQIQNVQRRQQFMRNFYATQAAAVTKGSMLGLDNSASLAMQANAETQGKRAIRQADRIEQLDAKAFERERMAARKESISSGLGGLGGIVGSFF